MNFYKNTIYFISILFLPTGLLHNKELRIIKSGLAPASVCKIGLEFYAELNNTSNEDIHVEMIPDECCLRSIDGEDCESLQIIGECLDVIPKGTSKTFTLVAPLIDPFERIGHCTIQIDSRPADRRTKFMRDTLNIHFDTRLKDNGTNLRHCKNIDENPFDDCKPVNCETYYNDKKSFFDKSTKRCRQIPRCVNRKMDKPKVYDPENNKCVIKEYINDADIDFIKSLSENGRHPKDILIIKTVNKPNPTWTNNDKEEQVEEANISNATKNLIKGGALYNNVTRYLDNNKYTFLVLALVVTAQFCLIITMIYCLANSSDCCNKKKVVRKFFNYRQDASVTTPLIGTSNMDTETTEFDYISESSNIDNKIKCYKACQKDRHSAKISMSDDILLKCLNRRDWNAKPKSEIIKEPSPKNINNKESEISNKIEIQEVKETPVETVASSHVETSSAVSEKEIKCHDYNVQSGVNFRAVDINIENVRGSVNTEKGAQACFSNDSIDDFLSERGMIFLGDNASKYSFNSSSTPDKSSLTELTSKTSKNNIIKNVLSYLSKSKMGTSSDPGTKKTNNKKKLELLHISHASIYSTSSELKNGRGIELVKESRSTV